MSGPWHPTGRGRVSSSAPRALAVCQRCGFTYNRSDLVFQYQWQGTILQNLQILVCKATCLDVPQPQLKTIIIPPDPVPVWQPRSEPYSVEVPNFMVAEDDGAILTSEDGNPFVTEGIQPNG